MRLYNICIHVHVHVCIFVKHNIIINYSSTYQSDCVGLSNYFQKLVTTASLLHLLREELGSLRGSFTPAPSNTMC